MKKTLVVLAAVTLACVVDEATIPPLSTSLTQTGNADSVQHNERLILEAMKCVAVLRGPINLEVIPFDHPGVLLALPLSADWTIPQQRVYLTKLRAKEAEYGAGAPEAMCERELMNKLLAKARSNEDSNSVARLESWLKGTEK